MAKPESVVTGARILDEERADYRPSTKVHMTEAGPVALSNWVGRIGERRIRVYRGAQAKDIPEAVKNRMRESGVEIGIVTRAELGLRALPASHTLSRN